MILRVSSEFSFFSLLPTCVVADMGCTEMKWLLALMMCAFLAAGDGRDSSPVKSGSNLPSTLASSGVTGNPVTLAFFGHVFQAVVTNDDKHAFVSLSKVSSSDISGGAAQPGSTGLTGTVQSTTATTKIGAIAVLEKSPAGWKRCRDSYSGGTQPVGIALKRAACFPATYRCLAMAGAFSFPISLPIPCRSHRSE
ncbi:hypothetical protein PCAR4_510043 [Paraburkholderia caribensis]|nr:hypothetical protein PCAR4_510043 [Paraburkholderia caribensis]